MSVMSRKNKNTQIEQKKKLRTRKRSKKESYVKSTSSKRKKEIALFSYLGKRKLPIITIANIFFLYCFFNFIMKFFSDSEITDTLVPATLFTVGKF